jgi:hypothetical protein
LAFLDKAHLFSQHFLMRPNCFNWHFWIRPTCSVSISWWGPPVSVSISWWTPLHLFQSATLDERYNTFSGSFVQQRRRPTYLVLASKIVRPQSTYQVLPRKTVRP